MNSFKPSPQLTKPVHQKQTLLDQFLRKKVKTDTEEQKLSNSQENKDKGPAPVPKQIKIFKSIYSLPHADRNWAMIKQRVQPIAEGNCTIDETLNVIEYALLQKPGMKTVDISLLRQFLNSFGAHNRQHAEQKVLPCIANLMLKTPELFPNPIPLMVQGSPQKVTLSKEQCACLLANMFMGTTIRSKSEKLPKYYNFYSWYHQDSKNESINLQKLGCLYYYFSKIADGIPDQVIRFERLVLRKATHGEYKMNGWRTCTSPLLDVVVDETARIEDTVGTIQIDFADQFLGGGVLAETLAQEEILFTISPECIVGLLFNERMTDEEGILMQGVETYSKYKDYERDFRFAGPYNQNLNVNQEKILDREIVAIDALNFIKTAVDEFSSQGLLRELNKAYIGFKARNDLGSTQKKTVATGGWGCDMFKADVQLKFILQWAAASKAGRNMLFCSLGDEKLKDADKILNKYANKTVGDIISDVFKAAEFFGRYATPKKDLFTFLVDM